MATIQVLQTLLTLFSIQLAVLISSGLASNFMITGGYLTEGQNLTYKEYSLTLQSDCNLVLKNGSTVIWQTMTGRYGQGCYLSLNQNGKLILFSRYGSYSHAIWNSRRESQYGFYALVLRYDGTLGIYGPKIWTASSSSAQPLSTTGTGLVNWAKVTDSVIYSGDVAPIGTTIVNGGSVLTLQNDCNLVLTSDGVTKWQTGVTDNTMHDCFVNLEANGEFRVKHWGGDILWTNRVAATAYAEFVLVLQCTADLGVYGPGIWSSASASGIGKPSADHGIEMITDK
ncbi:alpha-D-mannose-specific plant lectins domain-containing protein [Dioscorea alata]|uniref:Alpha-D-mannose-specific plant lectins domain-containing protein n=1 Tax=Dioscorea alata TaxID=55571 RepID=A0ACB7U9T3_DIOAL|nr:alpha-D-mannose-specific plant lectins domain-containing protein [Dioscorea alata]